MKIVVSGTNDDLLDWVCKGLSEKLGLTVIRFSEGEPVPDWYIISMPANDLCDPSVRAELLRNSVVVLLGNPDQIQSGHLWYIDGIIETENVSTETIIDQTREIILDQLTLRTGQPNTFGEIIRVTTFGESHGPAIGAVLDGIKPGIEISENDIQYELDRRKPGQSTVSSPRRERDRIQILSGIFEGKTTGAPIALVLFNTDADSTKYEAIKNIFRPGHADFTYYRKYGIRDYRGGGRSSGRETASRVACGSIARKILVGEGIIIRAHTVEIAGIRAETCDYDQIEQNPVRCADPKAAVRMERAILNAKDEGDSVGGIIRLDIEGVPSGLGDPVFFKLDARLCHAIMTLGAVKGVEIGRGFELARMRGNEANDQMSSDGFLSNNSGGISGGISTGQNVDLSIAVKPTSSIEKEQRTVDKDGRETIIKIEGRHDPCIVPRIIPVVENMAALVILDALEIQRQLRSRRED